MTLDSNNRLIPSIVTTDLSDVHDDEHNRNVANGAHPTRLHVPPVILTAPEIIEPPTTPTDTDTNDLSPTAYSPSSNSHSISHQSHEHRRSPSDPNLLSPILRTPGPTVGHRASGSLDVPDPNSLSPLVSPYSPSSNSEGSFIYPPSPTLSNRSSVHFQQPSTLALRENNPDGKSGLDSLRLLSGSSNHHRKASSAGSVSFIESTEGTEPDSHLKTPTAYHPDDKLQTLELEEDPKATIKRATVREGKRKKGDKKKEKEREGGQLGNGVTQIDLSTDTTDPTPFKIRPLHLASLVDPKDFDALKDLGGVDQILKDLGTHPKMGLPSHSLNEAVVEPESEHDADEMDKVQDEHHGVFCPSLADRRRVYGTNVVPTRKSKSLLQLMWLAFKDKILIMLTVAAVVSLALGLFQDFGTPPQMVTCEDGSEGCTLPRVDWVEGVAIIIAIIIVDVVGSVNDWQKERQFKKLNEKKDDRSVKVIRAGRERLINIKDVVVGDIAILEPGEIVPCDGIFLRGHGVKCDESGATGESDAIHKIPYASCLDPRGTEQHEDGGKSDCFMISGSKVLEGVGEYLIIAVGPRSFNGRILLALRGDTEETPLQSKLNYVAELIAKLGTAAGIILFSALMIRYFVELKTNPNRTPSEKGIDFVNILVISFTLVVVAVPEGLPLAVTLALAFATKRMTEEKLLVRVLASCETMANTSVVCTDKTGTLTQNEMSIVAGSLGIHAKFVRRLKDNEERTNALEETGLKRDGNRKHAQDFSIDQSLLNTVMDDSLCAILNESIAINSTAFEDFSSETGQLAFVGSKTETALLNFAKELGWKHYQTVRDEAQVVHAFPFSSERKASGVVVKLAPKKYRLFLKGASEILTKKCTRHVVVCQPHDTSTQTIDAQTSPIDELAKDNISRTIIFYANQMLRTIALCYRDFDYFNESDNEVSYEEVASDLILVAIVGIEDPLRVGVTEAVANCHRAGVAVKMCTGDNVLTARSIASQCGIFTPGGIVMEGPVFRTLDEHDLKEVLPRLQVLARSSPEDKKILVDNLKLMGEIVGVTGDGTNDGPALKRANVGFSMGIAGTEVAKEASDIILMDDNFSSIVSAIIWGRCVNDAVRKFLQFQISVNITAVIVTFVTAVASASEQSALSAVQLLWVNIIMDTFAALALATDPASFSSLDRKPERKNAPLFTICMTKQILGQAAYQTTIVLVFHFLGSKIWQENVNLNSPLQQRHQELQLQAFVFNAFVFCQIFNSVNSRRLDNKLNIFEGVLRNWYFITITLIEVAIQVIIIFVGGAAFQVAPITGAQWGASIALGLGAIPLGALLRYIPNELVERLFVKLRISRDPSILPTVDPVEEKGEWDKAIQSVRESLSMYSHVRGGRLRSSSIINRSRPARRLSNVGLSSLMTMVPTIVATSVAGRWTGEGSLSDPAHADPSRSSAALWEGKVQLHPETDKSDPAYLRWGEPSSRPTSRPMSRASNLHRV